MVRIILPKKSCLDACSGIKKALMACLSIQDKKRLVIYGKLSHNSRLNNFLGKGGFGSIDDLGKARGKRVIIGVHGITKEDLNFLKRNKIKFLDLTCSFVKKFLGRALKFEKRGYQIIIIGDKNHAEIKNVCSFLRKPIVINSKSEAEKIRCFQRAALLSQTTETLKRINSIIPVIKRKCENVIYVPTRCPETELRQKEAARLARKCGLVVVVGDKMSKNANNLIRICREITKTKLSSEIIDGKGRINIERFREIKKIGVIASASTPSFAVKEVIKCLKELKQ